MFLLQLPCPEHPCAWCRLCHGAPALCCTAQPGHTTRRGGRHLGGSVPSYRRSHLAGRQPTSAASACRRSSACHSPAPKHSQQRSARAGGEAQRRTGHALPGYLEEGHFADDVVVHINGDVQPHLVWQLHQQFRLIWGKKSRNPTVFSAFSRSTPLVPSGRWQEPALALPTHGSVPRAPWQWGRCEWQEGQHGGDTVLQGTPGHQASMSRWQPMYPEKS